VFRVDIEADIYMKASLDGSFLESGGFEEAVSGPVENIIAAPVFKLQASSSDVPMSEAC